MKYGVDLGSSGQMNDLINNAYFLLASLTQHIAFDFLSKQALIRMTTTQLSSKWNGTIKLGACSVFKGELRCVS